MSATGRYKSLMQQGRIKQFAPLPMSEFTVRDIADLMARGYVYYQFIRGRWDFIAGLPMEDL